jgi:prophage maintenance system killer protein
MQDIVIYKTSDNSIEVQVQFDGETVWLTQNEIAILFERNQSVISRHINNVFKESELDKKSNMQKVHIANSDKPVALYSLDVIISVGYRVKSKRGTQFRIWANKVLKEFLVKGYTINEKRLAQKEQEVKLLKDGIQILARNVAKAIEVKSSDNELLAIFSKGLSLLDDYDQEQLDSKGFTKKETSYPSLKDYQKLIKKMLTEFDSDVFGKEKDKGFQSSIAQIEKGFGKKDFYPTLEEKATTLLYLIVKNHSFVDGNKRIAAACFLKFLDQNSMLFNAEKQSIISNDTLASLTLFIASSKPEEMETVKRLVISVLNRNK